MFLPTAATRWLLLLLGLVLGAPLLGRAQIVDDSTKVLYGPKTTRVIYEAEVLADSTRGTLIDTSLVRWSQQKFWFRDSTLQQDLGAVGSASRPLLFQPNTALGARLGRNVFDRYAREASQVPYYDSRSPYSFFRFIQSGAGEQVFEISYSRSLKKNFGIGASYERVASNRLVGPGSSGGIDANLVEHNAATFFARYQTEDERYHLLVSLVDTRHRTIEQGGILPYASDYTAAGKLITNNLFVYDRAQVNLVYASNTDDRDQLHLFHSYRLLGRGVTAYHVFDIRRQYNGYLDNNLTATFNSPVATTDGAFYPAILRNPTLTADRVTYRQAENTVGFLGRTDRLAYNVYARYRAASLRQTSQLPIPATSTTTTTQAPPADVASSAYSQLFFGGTASFNYRTIYAVEVAGEYKPLGYNPLGEYWLRGRIRTGPLSAELLTTSYAPTLTQQQQLGNHYAWNNDGEDGRNRFSNTQITQLSGRLQQRLPLLADHAIDASVTVANVSNLIYYASYNPVSTNTTKQISQLLGPQQSDSKRLLIASVRHRFRVGKVYFDNQGTYTLGADSTNEALRIPALVTESRVFYQTHVFKKALLAQLGAELYYQSAFRAYGYQPSVQQFFVQDRFTIRNYAVANVFLTADIKAATIFLKVAYLNQGLGPAGYFTTPFYSGYPRRLQLGIRWRFFT
ncbi:putative porin [Hymenobacter bucti]|uniref:Porin n=1 Tax=Hymenobacter bucti TaxID=1844114 RepID=A0ABW4QUF3_9BACT